MLHPQHVSLFSHRGNITGNNVSATMFPSLARPQQHYCSQFKGSCTGMWRIIHNKVYSFKRCTLLNILSTCRIFGDEKNYNSVSTFSSRIHIELQELTHARGNLVYCIVIRTGGMAKTPLIEKEDSTFQNPIFTFLLPWKPITSKKSLEVFQKEIVKSDSVISQKRLSFTTT